MDYGKLAYLRYEDLNRRLSFEKPENRVWGALQFDFDDVSISENYVSQKAAFKTTAKAPLTADIVFDLSSESAAAAECLAYLNGAPLGLYKLDITAGARQYSVCFLCGSLGAGENTIYFCLNFEGNPSVSLKNTCIRLLGSIGRLTQSNKIDVIDEGVNVKLAYNDSEYVYYSYVNSSNKITVMSKYALRGGYSLSSCLYYSGGIKYDFLYFFIDEGKLFAEAKPYHSDFKPYRMLIDDNVTGVCSVKSYSPYGCMLFYIKGASVYCRHMVKDGVLNLILPCERQEAAFSQGAKNIFPVYGFDNACAFILNENSGENTLYMHTGRAEEMPSDTVKAYISAEITEGV